MRVLVQTLSCSSFRLVQTQALSYSSLLSRLWVVLATTS